MPTSTDILPLAATYTPADPTQLADLVRQACDTGTPVYPVGGATSLDFGLVPRRPGWALATTALAGIVDYPARDMTITVQAGITLETLAATLAAEGQRLPVDARHPAQATLGGLIATNYSGPRRYAHGTIRDYVIGISAVDGRGTAFKAGGRVVKNVAGYDFCKLLAGSLGTLAVITQVTLKLRPLPPSTALLTTPVRSLQHAEQLLAALVTSATTPAAIELLSGPGWQDDPDLSPLSAPAHLVVGLEGTAAEVAWMIDQLGREWRDLGAAQAHVVGDAAATALWDRLVAGSSPGAALVLKFTVRPSAVTQIAGLLVELVPEATIQAHAGNGIVIAALPALSSDFISKALIGRLQPAAIQAGGHVVVWSAVEELTRQAVFGGVRPETEVMRRVKHQFDPKDLLNPGRFVY